MKSAEPLVRAWLPLGITISLITLMIYGSFQQILRQSANEPQIQMVEEAIPLLQQGTEPTALLNGSVDLSKSLMPYLIVLDTKGEIVASSAELNSQLRKPPMGVLDYATKHGQHRLTWQPQPGVRSAIVVQPYEKGFIIAGRSLRETESRISKLSINLWFGWAITMLLTLLTTAFISKKN